MNASHFSTASLPLIGAIAALVLGGVVRRYRRDFVGQSFTALCALLAAWNFYFFLAYSLPCEDRSLSILAPLRVGPILLPVAILNLAIVTGSQRSNWVYSVLGLMTATAIVVVGANALGLTVTGLREFSFGCYSVPGPMYHLYTVEVVVCFVTASLLWLSDLRTAEKPEQRTVARLWFLGAGLALPLGLTHLLPAYGIPVYPLGNLGSAVWVALIAYGILEHRLLDIDAILSRTLAVVLSGLAVTVPALLFSVVLQRLSFGAVHADFTAAILSMLLVASAAIHWVHGRALKAAEKRAAERKLEQRVTLDVIARLALQHESRDRLFEAAASAIQLVFEPPTLVIGYRPNRKERVDLSFSRGAAPAERYLAADSPLLHWLEVCETSLLPGELEERNDPSATAAAEIMRRNRWAVCVPFKTSRSVLGFLAVGLKNGIDFYSASELEALERVGCELTLALDNLHMRDEVGIAQEALFRSERLSSLGTMVAAVVHEVRNPLVSLSTFVQLVEDRIGDRGFFQSAMPVVKAELDRVGKMLETLLSYTHVHKAVLGPVYFDVIFERVRLLLEPHAKRFGVKLVVDRRTDGPVVRGDEDRLMQVVFNLVMNAIEASPPGGVVTVEWDRVFRGGEYYGAVRVIDQGPGIPAADRAHIFLPFFTTKANGSGLGLSVSLQIVEEHHGFLEVGDAPGGGAVFTMAVPVYVETRKNLELLDPLAEPGAFDPNKVRSGPPRLDASVREIDVSSLGERGHPPEVVEFHKPHDDH